MKFPPYQVQYRVLLVEGPEKRYGDGGRWPGRKRRMQKNNEYPAHPHTQMPPYQFPAISFYNSFLNIHIRYDFYGHWLIFQSNSIQLLQISSSLKLRIKALESLTVEQTP